MKMKKYLILVVVSLIAIAGPAIGTDGTQKPSIDEKKHRLSVLKGVFCAQTTQKFIRALSPRKKVIQEILSDIDLNRYTTLKWIEGVKVTVVELTQAKRYGLTRQALQTDTELRLRQYGIKVMTTEEFQSKDKELREERIMEIAKHGAYTDELIDLLDSGQHDEAFKKMKEPEKSLIESLLNEESEERFLDSVMEYITKQEEYYKSSYSVAAPPTLYINVLPLIFEQQGMAVAYVSVELRSSYIILTRVSSRFLAEAVLWKRGSIISRGLDNSFSEIRDEVRDMVDEFINDYYSANPTKNPPVSLPTTKPSQKGLISAIIYDADDSLAMIDGKLVRVGDTIHNMKITNIYKDEVEFEKNGKTWTQKIIEAKTPEPKSPPNVSDIQRDYSAFLDEVRHRSKTTLLSAAGQWKVFEITSIDGWVKKVKRGTIFKTTSGNIYEVVDVVILLELEVRPNVTVLTDGQFYKLFIEGVRESLLCRKLNSGSRESVTSTDVIESRIIGVHDDILNLGEYGAFNGLKHGNIYKLDNGQIWEQVDLRIYIHIAVMPKVTIWQDGLIHKMKVDGIDEVVIVKQIK
jgi:hypothetical protein